MILNLTTFKNFILNNFGNSYHKCAVALNVNVSTISRVISETNKAGTKLLGNLAAFCKENDLDFNEFIIIQQTFNK